MSIFRCEICERSTDSDQQECREWKSGLVCNDCWLGDDEIALWHKQQAAEAMYDALESLLEIHSLANESPFDAFERIGERFRRDTGLLRPGKDSRSGPAPDERERAFAAWWHAKESRAVAALAAARGEKP